MKLFLKIAAVIIFISILGGYIYWEKNKNNIINNSIKTSIKKKTDSLYFIHFDSSAIDEINGNASFYKVSLQSDSLQKKLLAGLDSLPNALFSIRVEKVSAIGVNVLGLVNNENISAKSILLYKPFIQIINTGVDKPKAFTYNDTLELYQKILGKFKSIHANEIKVIGGTVLMTDIKGKALTTFENINIALNNFVVDSTKDYQNMLSYFIKDVKVTVENIQLPASKKGARVNLNNVLYDAPARLLKVGSIQQYQLNNSTPIVDVKNVQVNKLNTDTFILNQKLKAGLLNCDGGFVTIYRKTKNKLAGQGNIELSSGIIDEAQIDGINLDNTKFIIIDPSTPNEPAFIINDVKFSASNAVSVANGSTISDLINNSDWELSAKGFSFLTKEKFYNFIASDIALNNKNKTLKIKKLLLKPLLSEEQFVKKITFQRSRYDLTFNDIELDGIDLKKLVNDDVLEVDKARLQPIIKVFNDATMPVSPDLKVALYPQQSMALFKFPFYIKNITVQNGAVFYKERGEDSKMIGIPNFTKINATLGNVTNIPAKIKANGMMSLKADALFLNTGKLNTEWQLPLRPQDSIIKVKGILGYLDATLLNSITQPLGLVLIKSGKIQSVSFNLTCSNYKGLGTETILYNDLKVQVLKLKEAQLKKRGLLSFVANTVIKNDNPKNNLTYVSTINIDRDIHNSFFNLLWQCIFDGAKKTVIRK